MTNHDEDNFDDIDLNEIFNDFDANQSTVSQESLHKYDLKKASEDESMEFNKNNFTESILNRKRTKTMRTKQKTMYDYVTIVSYKHKHFYSSLDNTITTKTVLKGQKRSLNAYQQSTSIGKRNKTNDYSDLSSTPSSTPDFIDNLLQYLDQRSRTRNRTTTDENEIKRIIH